MKKMSIISVIFIISTVLLIEITGEEKFCEKDRKLLLGGVFNYDNNLFGYSWKEVKEVKSGSGLSVQSWLVWSYRIKDNRLVQIGKDKSVDDVFPGVPLFRAGFGLTVKCNDKDYNCQSYRQLVFIFFQTSYKVFRFVNNIFSAEKNKSKIPWGIQTEGEISDWSFGDNTFEGINAVMFLSGNPSQIFVVSKTSLYVSSVHLKANSLKWSKLSQSEELTSTLGGFVVGSTLFINKNDVSDSVLLKYDKSGQQLDQISVWKYFGCDTEESESTDSYLPLNRDINESKDSPKGKDDNLAFILLISIVLAIVFVDIIAGLFWFSVYWKNNNSVQP